MADANALCPAFLFVTDNWDDAVQLCVAKYVSSDCHGGIVCIPTLVTSTLVSLSILTITFPNSNLFVMC